MSVKTIFADPSSLSTATNKEFKAKFFTSVKKLSKKHTSPETAAPCYVQTNFQYKDGEGYLALFGKTSKFKKYFKDNATKEEAARGYCFISSDDKGGLVFNFMPVAGKLKTKENIIAKAQKAVVSASKLGFVLAKGEFVDNDALDAATENMPEAPDEAEDTAEAGAEDAPQATEAAPQATEDAPQATEAAPQATQTAAPEVTPAAKAVLGKIGSFSAHIAAASKQFGIPESQIKAIIATESAGVPTANSSSKPESGGAAGLMQVTSGTWPDTCKQFPELAKYNDYFKYRYDPLANIMVGTATLKLKAKVTGVAVDDPNFATVAVTAYNAGEGIVKKAMEFAKAGGSQNPAADFTKPEFLKKAIQAYPSVYNYYMPGQGGGKNNKSGSVAEAIELKYKEISKYGPKVSMYLAGAKAEAGEATNTTPANPAQPDGAEAQAKAKAMTLLQDIFKLYQELAKTPA